jgi:hypothetical protein
MTNPLPADAQQLLMDAAAKPIHQRQAAIERAIDLVRRTWPECFRGEE